MFVVVKILEHLENEILVNIHSHTLYRDQQSPTPTYNNMIIIRW